MMDEEIDLDNFIFIGNKIADKIYEIPKEDLEFFNKTKERILGADAMLRGCQRTGKRDALINFLIKSELEKETGQTQYLTIDDYCRIVQSVESKEL